MGSFSILRYSALTGCFILGWSSSPKLDCSPTFAGVPVAATFLMHQSYKLFENHFPNLELSPWFSIHDTHFSYQEQQGNNLWERFLILLTGPSYATCIAPVYEKLDPIEEKRMGTTGIRKLPVGSLEMKGKCSLGCAQIELQEMKLFKLNQEMVWNYKV